MLILAVVSIGGCGDKGGGNHDAGAGDLGRGRDSGVTCPNDLPTACPSPMPSWDGGVSEIVAAKCVPCHNPSGVAYSAPLTDYAKVYAKRTTVEQLIYSCYMPPPDAAQMDSGERQTILTWLVCGAPNN